LTGDTGAGAGEAGSTGNEAGVAVFGVGSGVRAGSGGVIGVVADGSESRLGVGYGIASSGDFTGAGAGRVGTEA
jgi:hypothetical protein